MLFCMVVELCYFILTSVTVLIRTTLLSEVAAYRNNALMNANLVYLWLCFADFRLFNLIFVGGFFKTAYKFAKPLCCVYYRCFFGCRHWRNVFHIPVLSALNAFGFRGTSFAGGRIYSWHSRFLLLTAISMCWAIKNFEKIGFVM